MRKFTSLFFLLLSIVTYARQITSGQAEAVAADFLRTNASFSLSSAEMKAYSVADKESEAQPYYVFNKADNRGFVIVAGDDRAQKILGYTDNGSFDTENMPPQLRALLNNYSQQIKSIPESALRHPSWTASAVSASGTGVMLETAEWGQGAPYNSLCPTIGGINTPTGCVATAMAIVMKYHKWPEKYNWDAMPMQNVTSENSSEIATLMKDAGSAVLMQYSSSESTANMNFTGHRLQHVFKYSPECQFISSRNFTDNEWLSMLKADLDAGNPVIYNGTGSGNHAFIIDGYDNNDLYHVNWGWDGQYNGMFAINALTPGADNFSNDAAMVINIVPDKSGKEYSTVFCDAGYFWATGQLAPGGHFSTDSPERTQPFDFTCLGLSYPCNESGQIGLLLFDKDGNVKEVIKEQIFTETDDNFGLGLWSSDLTFYNISIASQLAADDYITLASRKSSSDSWHEILGTIEAPLKKVVSDIKKDISKINIVNKTDYSTLKMLREDWIDIPSGENQLEFVKGALFNLNLLDDTGRTATDVSISVEGKGVYGDSELSKDGHAFFKLYGDEYTVTIDYRRAGTEKTINVSEAGTLSEALKGVDLSGIGSLTVTGSINAQDLWYIRDNIKTLNTLDISEVKVMACEATDPIEAFRISGPEHEEDAIPTYALTGLSELVKLSLPKNIKSICSNSMMSLAISQIEIPSTVSTFGLNVFFGCSNLKTVVSKMPQPVSINDCIFTSTQCSSSGVLYVPVGSSDAYKVSAVWKDFAQIIEDDNPPVDSELFTYEGLKYRIHGKAFYLSGYEQSQLSPDVVIPDAIPFNGYECQVLGIDDNAMQNAHIKSFTMSNTITTTGSFVFEGSSVVKVWMSDNIKVLPFRCIDGSKIEELHLPENAEYIGNSLYCNSLKKLHIPKKLKCKEGYNGSIGGDFACLEEITVDSENEEWSIHDGILYWKGLSHLILVPNNREGKLIIPDETTDIASIQNCNSITEISLGKNIKSISNGAIERCENLKHINFNNNIIFSTNCVISILPSLESFTIGDFIWSSDNCFYILPSLKYVYLVNENPVDFSRTFYYEVNETHDYFTSSLNPQVKVPDNSIIYVPGGVKSDENNAEMWKYQIDRTHGRIKIEPLIPGIVIESVTINGISNEPNSDGIYEYNAMAKTSPTVEVSYTLHERQPMTTYYDEQFNSTIPDFDLSSSIFEITKDKYKNTDIYTLQGILIKSNATQSDIDILPSGIYIINGQKVIIQR